MKQNSRKAILIGAVVVLVLALGAIAVFAQSDPVTPVPDTDTAVPFGRGFDHMHGFGGMRGSDAEGDHQADLAAALGITVEELQAAQQKAQAARLAQAVEDGTLTQDQANLMLAMQALRGELDHEAIMAEALGLSVEELQAAQEDGTLRDLLANITPAELHANMQAAMTAAVQQAVADNVITQEQADLVLAQDGFGLGGMRGFGGGHGRGGMRGFGGHGFYGQPDTSGQPAPLEGISATGA